MMAEGEHFVEKHQVNLIKRVSNTGPILDELLHENIIQQDSYDEIKALPTSQEKMTALFSGPLESSGGRGKAMFYRLLNKHEPYLIHELRRTEEPVETMASVIELLLETLAGLSDEELEMFKDVLRSQTDFQRHSSDISLMLSAVTDNQDMVFLMVLSYGQQSVNKTKEVLKKMNRTDLVQRLSHSSSGPKKKLSDEHRSALIQREATMTSVREKLLETLEDLSYGELEQFKLVLQRTRMKKGLPRMSRQRLETADRVETVEMMMETYGQQSVEVTSDVLMEMNRSDLVKRLSDFSSGSKGPSGGLELEGCGSIIKDSSDWTKLEPEVNSTGADEAPTYSLQSEAGHFECSVSGLRWICKGKVRFKYQFSSVEEHMERIKSMQYMPAGPLMNITVLAGKLDEVHLPHWICIVDNPTILDKFAVLHIDDCGDNVEKVSEVTSSHVKLCEPVFSLKMVILRLLGVSVEINCNVLIYNTDKTFLTLHVYLIPRDPGLEQELDKRNGYRVIQKPHPEKPLKMNDSFILTSDLDSAEIELEKLMLRYENPNFFEVFIDNPDKEFKLQLTKENECEPVWTRTIRKDDYQSTVHSQAGRPSAGAEGGRCTEMASKTATRLIKDALADLSKENFEKFRSELLDREEEPRVKRNQVEDKNYIVVADVLVSTFTEAGALAVVVELLKEIGCNEDATKLEREIGEQSSNPGSSDTVRPSAGAEGGRCTGAEFVDKHSDVLIDRVSGIASILDELLNKKVITQDAYDEILDIPTKRDKMRKLLSGPLHAAGPEGKEVFYKILVEKKKYLIADLKKKK